MRYLFVAYGSPQENNAVFNICFSLAADMAAHGRHAVTILSHTADPALALYEERERVRLRRFYCPVQAQMHQMWTAYKKTRSRAGLLAAGLKHPAALLGNIRRAAGGDGPVVRAYSRHITALCREEGFDAVVSFSAPYHTAKAVAGAVTHGAKKLVYMADPYATHYEMGGKRAIRQEAGVLERVDAVFLAPALVEGYRRIPALAGFLPKITPLEFPCLSQKSFVPYRGFAAEKINLLYTGNFYADIRPAEEMLFLVQEIKEPRILLTLMGDFLSQLPGDAQRAQAQALIRQGLLCSLPPQPAEVAYGAMEGADVLLSIGNAIPHMVPSKLLDYIGTGRPIVHVARRGDDPALPLLERYPLHLNLVAEGGRLSAGQGEEMARFCLQNKGRLLDRDQVYHLYSHYTAAHAAAVLAQAVRKGGKR